MNSNVKSLFVAGTQTNIGKTYIAALMIKKLQQEGLSAGYYKAASSGSNGFCDSDAGYVKKISGIEQSNESMISYIYQNAFSPHLAAHIEGNALELEKICNDFQAVKSKFEYVTVEGSGGVVCPLRYDDKAKIFLTDIVKKLNLSVVLVGDAGLGAINAVTLSIEHLKTKNIPVTSVILNNYTGSIIERDNIKMIERLNNIPVATVRTNATTLDIDIKSLYKE